MKARLTAWLSALLLFSAVFNAPVVRFATNSVSVCSVYSEQKRKPRAEKQTCETPLPPPRLSTPAYRTPAARDQVFAVSLDSCLFQRPPPALSL